MSQILSAGNKPCEPVKPEVPQTPIQAAVQTLKKEPHVFVGTVSLSEFLKIKLKENNMKADQLRAKAGLSSGNLSRHLSDANFGKSGRRMSVGKAIKIFDALGIPLEQLRHIDWM